MHEPCGLLIFLGAGLAILMGIAGLANRGLPLLQSLIYLLVGALLLEHFLTHAAGFTADMETHPLQTAVFLSVRCARYSVGPLFLAFYLRLTTYKRSKPKTLVWHFLPQALAWALGLAYMASSLTGSAMFGTLRVVMGICTDASLIHLLAYALGSVLVARNVGNRSVLAAALVTGTVIMCATGLAALYMATGWKHLETWSQVLVALAVVALFLWLQISPEGLERFGQNERAKAYQRSTLSGVDTELLGLRLKELMESNKIFRDELLTLEDLARKLCVPRNQLSEFLNCVLETPFNNFVNRYRIEEVKDLLLTHPEQSILSHAYASGFNSKSVFYEAFRRFTGMTPQEYRKRHLTG